MEREMESCRQRATEPIDTNWAKQFPTAFPFEIAVLPICEETSNEGLYRKDSIGKTLLERLPSRDSIEEFYSREYRETRTRDSIEWLSRNSIKPIDFARSSRSLSLRVNQQSLPNWQFRSNFEVGNFRAGNSMAGNLVAGNLKLAISS